MAVAGGMATTGGLSMDDNGACCLQFDVCACRRDEDDAIGGNEDQNQNNNQQMTGNNASQSGTDC